jgi:DNA-binding HxlR family transcriptional regulator
MTDQERPAASCPMDFILRILMGPWTTYILYTLGEHGPQRFGELKRRVTGVSAKMLTERLRALEQADLISRAYEPTIPPKVTYALTARGRELGGVLDQLAVLGRKWMADGVTTTPPRVAQAAE